MTPELQQIFERVKKELTDGTISLAIPNSEKPVYFLCDASNLGIGAALLQKKSFWENGNNLCKLFVSFLPQNSDLQPFFANAPL